MTLSIVVPCYNEEAAIFLFYEKIIAVFSKNIEPQEPITPEFIFVDDGSADSTFTVLKNLAARDSRVRYIIFSRNFGKEAALLAPPEMPHIEMLPKGLFTISHYQIKIVKYIAISQL
jgi:glycosyltransferase involved in cell wall biosynthesis